MDLKPSDCACSKTEMLLFQGRQVQTVMDKGAWVDIFPLNNLSSSGPIEFVINGSADEYIDLNDTKLVIRCKVVNAADNADLPQHTRMAPVNNWLHSMFSDVSLTIGDKQIEGGNFMYPYRAYLHNLLTFDEDVKKCQLRASGWYADDGSNMNTGAGFTTRMTWIAGSAKIELAGPLCLDMFTQNKYLINNVDMRIKLTQARPEFQFISVARTATDTGGTANAITPKLIMDSAVLYVRRVKITPSVIVENESQLSSQNAIYPLQHSEMITYTIPSGSLSHNKESLFRGLLPKLLIIGLVRNNAFNGTYSTNPFNFRHENINHIALYREGESIPARPFTPNFTDGTIAREYMSFMQALQMYNINESNGITLDNYKNGYTLFAFNLTPDLCISSNAQPYRDGNLRLEIKFSEATAETINVLAMAIFDGRVEITKHRNIIVDYKI